MIDLNLLRTLLIINEKRNLKLAGVKLGITESAVSKQLSKLREAFDNPVFERTSSGLKPTALTVSILPSVAQSIKTLDNIFQPIKFIPEMYDKPISIAMPSMMIDIIGMELYNLVTRHFPKASINFKVWDESSTADIINNQIDIAVHLWNEERPVDVYQQVISEDKLVVCISREHGADLDWEQIQKWPFIRLKSHGWSEYKRHYLNYINNLDAPLNYKYETEAIAFAHSLMRQERVACVLPKRLLDSDFLYIESPSYIEMDVKFATSVSVVNRSNPLYQYLFTLLKQSRLGKRFRLES
ncbi:LysR family transcriptional regulator [Vibrio sp. WXL103]|uniref:LysR family transcriptional regulator n=1 Tax=unclassified Vibrio TaxID=2614977 RepID=UPI003EC5CED6